MLTRTLNQGKPREREKTSTVDAMFSFKESTEQRIGVVGISNGRNRALSTAESAECYLRAAKGSLCSRYGATTSVENTSVPADQLEAVSGNA